MVGASYTTIEAGARSVKVKGTEAPELAEPSESVRMSSQISLRGLANTGLVELPWGVAAGSVRSW